jgi:hypothetical protein
VHNLKNKIEFEFQCIFVMTRKLLIATDPNTKFNNYPKIPPKPSKNLATNKKPLTKNLVSGLLSVVPSGLEPELF